MDNLREMERTREAYWLRHPSTSSTKLHWRAVTVRHCFHVLPGESILEIGAGSGLWTKHLTSVLRGENPVTAAAFNADLAEQAAAQALANTSVALVSHLDADLSPGSFDYVVGTAILCHDKYSENLRQIHRLLKPGGQLLFFEANYWNPQVLVKSAVPPLGRRAGNARCQIGMRKYRLMKAASHEGFTDIEIVPYDIVHPRTPRRMVPAIQETAFVLEHVPGLREICGTLYIWARKPADGPARRPSVNLARHHELRQSTSVVVPCRNEAMNVPRLVSGLMDAYGDYITEIIIVNDDSGDATAAVTRSLAAEDPRIRLIDRTPPGGVGRALRDGYDAARGKYILSMDCDFQLIVPELRDLFDVVAAGHAGAIGSRFSHESVLINYPFAKIIANRAFHLLVRLVLHQPVRDISNNLKLYRAEILKDLDIRRPDFGANAETGLKPIAAGHDIQEVPISWINRTDDMGASNFGILRFAPSYLRALADLVRAVRSEPAEHAKERARP
ncbi:MAG: glycosyltransferase [Thermoleophilaceae bacterium]|nr:glycosyltransferase [Thermoleophilaceae bacterium]